MILNKASRVVGALATMFLLHGAVSAASVGMGQFNVASSVYITSTGFYIGTDAPTAGSGANQTATVYLPATGPFSDLTALEPVQMKSFVNPPAMPGGTFNLPQFMVLPDGIDVDLTGLPLSTYPLCTGANSAGCQAVAGSPITLSSTPSGVSATFDVMGRAYYAGQTTYTPVNGIFTAQFVQAPDNTIAGLLNDFSTHGFITTSFSATFTTMPTPTVPEPASIALLGVGLFGLGLLGKKKLSKS